MYIHVCVWAHRWVEIRLWHRMSSSVTLHVNFWGWCHSLNLELTGWQNWPISELPEDIYLCGLSSSGVTDLYYHVVFLYWCWGSKSGSLMFVQQPLDSQLPSPKRWNCCCAFADSNSRFPLCVSFPVRGASRRHWGLFLFIALTSPFSLFQSIWESDKASLYSKVTEGLTEQGNAFIHFQFQWTSLLCTQELALSPDGCSPTPAPPSPVMLDMDMQEVEGSLGVKSKGKAERAGGYYISVRKGTELLSPGHSFLKSVLKSTFLKTSDLDPYPPSQSQCSVL